MVRTALEELENIVLMHFGALPKAEAHGWWGVSVLTNTGPVKRVESKELVRIFDLLPEALAEAKRLRLGLHRSDYDEE